MDPSLNTLFCDVCIASCHIVTPVYRSTMMRYTDEIILGFPL